jgi:DnaJ family protein B protein 6
MYVDVDTTLFKCFRLFENGKETTMMYENDVLVSKTINGVPQPITAS